jgi:hypothetical protein
MWRDMSSDRDSVKDISHSWAVETKTEMKQSLSYGIASTWLSEELGAMDVKWMIRRKSDRAGAWSMVETQAWLKEGTVHFQVGCDVRRVQLALPAAS